MQLCKRDWLELTETIKEQNDLTSFNRGLSLYFMRNIFLKIISVVCLASIPTLSYAIEIHDFINKRNCDQILDKGYYQICYDYSMKGAKYVGYNLDGSKVNSGNIKKRPRFYPDKAIPRQYRTTSKDYPGMSSMQIVVIWGQMPHLTGRRSRCTQCLRWRTSSPQVDQQKDLGESGKV